MDSEPRGPLVISYFPGTRALVEAQQPSRPLQHHITINILHDHRRDQPATQPIDVMDQDADDEFEHDASISDASIASVVVDDRWQYEEPHPAGEEPRIYKPRVFDSMLKQRNVYTRDLGYSGFALVDFSSIPGQPLWVNTLQDSVV